MEGGALDECAYRIRWHVGGYWANARQMQWKGMSVKSVRYKEMRMLGSLMDQYD